MRYYLEESDYIVAEEMGIDRDTLYHRVYVYGWPVLKATTTPKRRHKGPYEDYKELCEKNGISRTLFNERMNRSGYSPIDAATKPVDRTVRLGQPQPKLSRKDLKRAEENGISRETASIRVYKYKWDVERAVTEPVHTQYRSKKKVKA